jgi:hypothetical protein
MRDGAGAIVGNNWSIKDMRNEQRLLKAVYHAADSPLRLEGLARLCAYDLRRLTGTLEGSQRDDVAEGWSLLAEAETALVMRIGPDGSISVASKFAAVGARAEPAVIVDHSEAEDIRQGALAATGGVLCNSRHPTEAVPVDAWMAVPLPSGVVRSGTAGRMITLACNSRRGTKQELVSCGTAPFEAGHKLLVNALLEAWTSDDPQGALKRLSAMAAFAASLAQRYLSYLSELAIRAISLHDAYTGLHSANVRTLSEVIIKRLAPRLPLHQRGNLWLAAAAHDIGKLAVREEVLNKPSLLGKGESAMVGVHAVMSQELMTTILGPGEVAQVVGAHHRWYDGSRGPGSGARDEIPRLARIIAVADSFDTMVSARAYQPVPMTFADAAAELERHKGKQFDPNVVDALLKAVDKGDVARAGIREVEVASATAAVKKATDGFTKDL